jgi:hypothetical protein
VFQLNGLKIEIYLFVFSLLKGMYQVIQYTKKSLITYQIIWSILSDNIIYIGFLFCILWLWKLNNDNTNENIKNINKTINSRIDVYENNIKDIIEDLKLVKWILNENNTNENIKNISIQFEDIKKDLNNTKLDIVNLRNDIKQNKNNLTNHIKNHENREIIQFTEIKKDIFNLNKTTLKINKDYDDIKLSIKYLQSNTNENLDEYMENVNKNMNIFVNKLHEMKKYNKEIFKLIENAIPDRFGGGRGAGFLINENKPKLSEFIELNDIN